MPFFPGSPIQLVDPTAIVGLAAWLRALIAFVAVLSVGSLLLWRFDGVVERSIAASIARPLSSLSYGLGAQASIAFVGTYLTVQLTQLPASGWMLTGIGVWLGVGVFGVIGGLGFTVVGAAVVELGWARQRWYGLLLGSTLAGVAALAQPLVVAIVWAVVVSMGIGGPVRHWFHASEDVG